MMELEKGDSGGIVSRWWKRDSDYREGDFSGIRKDFQQINGRE